MLTVPVTTPPGSPSWFEAVVNVLISAAVADCTTPLSFTNVNAVLPVSVILLFAPPPTISKRSAEVPVIVSIRDKSTVVDALLEPRDIASLAFIVLSVGFGCTISSDAAAVIKSPSAFSVENAFA